MKKNFIIIILLSLVIVPLVSYAQFNGIYGYLAAFSALLRQVIIIIFGLAMIYFFWGTSQFILNAGDSKKREEGRQRMLWGIIALFVMFSIYGILRFLSSTIDIGVTGSGQFQTCSTDPNDPDYCF